MTRCNFCKMTKTGGNQLFPIGSTTPDYYILGDSVNPAESENNQVFSMATQQGNYLINLLGSVGINLSNAAFFKLIRCTYSYQIQADDECRDVCARYAMMDVFKRNPKVIIALGSEVSKYLLGDRFKTITSARGKLYDVIINNVKFKVLPTYDPNYVINSGSMQVAETFFNDLKYAKMYVNGELIDIGEKELAVATTYAEFMEYYKKNLESCMTPAYDIETNAVDPRYDTAKIVGFSLAPSGSTGVYIVRESLEYKMPTEDWNKIVDVMRTYIPSRTVRVHNCMYEVPFTKNEWDVMINEFDDTLIKARLLLGGKSGAGLKDQAIRNLGYPDWDKDLGVYLSCLKTMRDKLKPTSGGNNRWDFDILQSQGLAALAIEYEKSPESLDKRSSEVRDAYLRMYRCLESYYYGKELEDIINLIGVEIVALVLSNHTGLPSYGSVPMRLIAKYGAMDAVATQDLNTHLDSKMVAESEELGIDLYKGYGYWKGHFTVATHMEMSGLYWNDTIATNESKWYADTCLESAKYMINSGYLDNYLFENNKWRLREYILEEALDKVVEVFGEIRPMKSCIKLADGTKITHKNLLYELDLATNGQFSASMYGVVLDLVKREVEDAKYYTDLKGIFNPGSPKQENKDLLNSILVDNDVRLAHFMNQLNVLIESPDFDIKRYPRPDRDLLQVLIDCREFNSEVDKYNESLNDVDSIDDIEDTLSGYLDEDYEEGELESGESSVKVPKVKLSSRDTFERFKEVMNGLVSNPLRSTEIQMLCGTSLNYRLVDTKEPTLIELNQYYVIMGIDVEDVNSWTPAYTFLYNFRMWKKCNKMITSYITGNKVGRGAVSIVDKESYMRGDTLTKRKRPYYSDKAIDPETECCVMQSNFKVCNAETGRWQTGMHTIPAGSAIKNIYTSRFENGVMIMPDYSAMEVRVIAGASGCEPMLKVFREGGDIHTNNAALIWNKPVEEITKEERRYSKMGTFALLYGADYKGFGDNFLDGDRAKAKQIFENFFRAFPEIKTWVDKRHEEMKTKGKVTTMSQRYINISPDNFKGDTGKALRASQNYPIQASGSDMAGYVLYKIHEFIQKNNFKSKCVLFIHDSLEVDIHPDEFLAIGSQVIPLMNQFPMEEWNMVTSADLAVGISLGQECEIKKLETNEDYTEGTMIIEGYDDCLQPLFEAWRNTYSVMEIEDIEEPKSVYVPRNNIWIPKLAVSKMFGTYRVERKVKVHVKK